MIAVLNDLYEENAALKARIAQLEALLKEAMHRPNPDMDLHNRIRTCRGSYTLGTACGHCERCTWERKHPVPQVSKVEKLEARIAQLEALLTEAMHRPNPDMDLHNRIRAAIEDVGD